MGEIEAFERFKPPPGFYGSFVRQGDQREGQWMFRVAVAQEMPEVVWQLGSLTEKYGQWYESQDPVNWYPNLALIPMLSTEWRHLDDLERALLVGTLEWGRKHHINFPWIWAPAMTVVSAMYRHGPQKARSDLHLHHFASSDNLHGVPDVERLGELCVIAGKWDPQMQTFNEFEARQRFVLTSAFRQHLKERLIEYRKEVEGQMLAAGYVRRPARRQGIDPFRPYRWLARHVVCGETMTEIAASAEPRVLQGKVSDDEGLHRASIERAVKKAAKECGIVLSAR